MNVGDVVLYSIQDKSYKALVLFAHTNEPDYLGANGEPLLHLVFLAPDRESTISKSKIGWLPNVFTVHDVAHVSSKTQTVAGSWQELPEDKRIADLIEFSATLQEAIADQGKQIAALQKSTEPTTAPEQIIPQLPNAEDLDAVAAEQQAAEATQGDTNV